MLWIAIISKKYCFYFEQSSEKSIRYIKPIEDSQKLSSLTSGLSKQIVNTFKSLSHVTTVSSNIKHLKIIFILNDVDHVSVWFKLNYCLGISVRALKAYKFSFITLNYYFNDFFSKWNMTFHKITILLRRLLIVLILVMCNMWRIWNYQFQNSVIECMKYTFN